MHEGAAMTSNFVMGWFDGTVWSFRDHEVTKDVDADGLLDEGADGHKEFPGSSLREVRLVGVEVAVFQNEMLQGHVLSAHAERAATQLSTQKTRLVASLVVETGSG